MHGTYGGIILAVAPYEIDSFGVKIGAGVSSRDLVEIAHSEDRRGRRFDAKSWGLRDIKLLNLDPSFCFFLIYIKQKLGSKLGALNLVITVKEST